MKNRRKYQYPWRTNNKLSVLIDGNEYFSAMIQAIKNANVFIYLEVYLFESGNTATSFIDALIEANHRGVKVFLLLDDYGSKNLSIADKKRLTDKSIQLALYNPLTVFRLGRSLKRDHRKLLITDNKTAFIGGAGITDNFNPKESRLYWHDVMLMIEGNIANDLTHSFHQIWQQQSSKIIDVATPFYTEKLQENSKTDKARVLIGQGIEHNEINRSIVSKIRSSRNTVWLTSPYFISSWKIRRALRHAAKKGVDVRLIFPGPHSDHQWITHGIRRYYPKLLKANIRIYEYQPRFTHAKIILCDEWFTIGSSNLDRWNLYLNLDMNIEVYNKEAHLKIYTLFKLNFSISKLLTFDDWKSRSLIQRLKEWASGQLILFLGFISRTFRR